MFTDLTGKKRYKINLHCHTTLSDGHLSPEKALELYAAVGYDMLALTDHWHWQAGGVHHYEKPDGTSGEITVLSGAEYNVGGGDGANGVFHILALGCTRDPELDALRGAVPGKTPVAQAGFLIRRIREAGGFAVLAHPAWSLNTPEQIRVLCEAAGGAPDATEIYNGVSECHMSDRPYSGLIVDQLAMDGLYLPLLATDDTHYYDGDECRGMIMVEADAVEKLGLWEAIRQNRFYATNGPEIHLERIDASTVRLLCSPADKIAFLSHLAWTDGRMIRGENLTQATYALKEGERYVRAEIRTADGRAAWSRIIETT